MAEDLGQRPGAGGAGQSGGGIVGAKPLVVEEAEEAAQRRRLARDGRRLERKPGFGEALELVLRGARQPAAE